MATVTRTPEEQLALALDRIDVAKANLEQRRQEELDARAKADQTRGLVAAAQRQWKNAEARYRVLAESAQLVSENVAHRSERFQTRSIPRRSCTRTEWM